MLCVHACLGAVESLNSPLISLFFSGLKPLGTSGWCHLDAGQRQEAREETGGQRKLLGRARLPSLPRFACLINVYKSNVYINIYKYCTAI